MRQRISVYLQETPVGKGVFASRSFPPTGVVAEVLGRVIDDADYGSDYCIDLGGAASLEPDAPFRFLNHSCSPNCEFVMWDEPENPGMALRIWLAAIRPIAAGEQLTIDYAWSADAAIACHCDSLACRGWIVDEAELGELWRRKFSIAI